MAKFTNESRSSPVNQSSPDDDPWADDEPSDIPRLEATHKTAGYREGIDAGRNQTDLVQSGFDEGYPVGAELGLRVGRVLGILSEFARFGGEEEKERLRKAEQELDLSKLLEAMEGELGKAQRGEDVWELDSGWLANLKALKYWSQIAESLAGTSNKTD